MKIPITKTAAHYHKSNNQEERDNPLVSAMPPRFEPKIIKKVLSNILELPDLNHLTDLEREEVAEMVHQTRIATAEHYELYCQIYSMIRKGYLVRNPLRPEVISWSYGIGDPNMELDKTNLSQEHTGLPNTTADAMFISGPSGVGKSTMTELTMFKCFPQVIEHSLDELKEPQIVYLKVDMPHDGSRGALLDAILTELDCVLSSSSIGNQNYSSAVKKTSTGYKNLGQLERTTISALNRHHVGVLLIDEFQNLLVANQNRRKEMLQLLDTFTNKLFVPTIKIGTPNSRELVSNNARHLRRLGEPFFFSPLSDDEHAWKRTMNALFAFQPIKNPIERDPQIENLLKSLSAGIPDFLMKLWKGVLVEAIRSGKEKVNQTLIKQVFKRQFPLLRTAIRNIQTRKIGPYTDLITAQQLIEEGNDKNAIKFIDQFAKATQLKGIAAKDVLEDLENAVKDMDLTDAQRRKLEKIKAILKEKGQQASGPQTIEHKPNSDPGSSSEPASKSKKKPKDDGEL